MVVVEGTQSEKGRNTGFKKNNHSADSKRIIVIDHDKVKPNSDAYHYLRRIAGGCGKPWIQIVAEAKKVIVSETACAICVNRCKQCPGDAVSVVKLPTNLSANTTHRYGPNTFKLHGLPAPRPGTSLVCLVPTEPARLPVSRS
jgi:ATP-binding cassette subfamily E protein 1